MITLNWNQTPSGMEVTVLRGGIVKTRAVLMENEAMRFQEKKVLLLGYFESENDSEAAAAFFDAVQHYARERCLSTVIGPMNGSTWAKYRTALPFGTSFFLDVVSKPYETVLFEANRYREIAAYLSVKMTLDDGCSKRLLAAEKYFTRLGISVHPLDKGNLVESLKRVHALSLESFSNNFLYTPLEEKAFLDQYVPLIESCDAHHILMAVDSNNRLCGFLFGLADRLTHEQAILKTLAVLPEIRFRGLGVYLCEIFHKNLFKSGFKTVIHALMHETNPSANIHHGRGEICRRYRLYGKAVE